MKTIPQRTCVGCNTTKNKSDLIRIVRTKDGEILVDRTGKVDGRGAYICDNIECLDKAIKNKKIEKALDMKIENDIYENLRGVIIDK